MIVINIDVMLAKRKMTVTELSEKVGITIVNMSVLKNGKAKGVKFSTLNAICRALDCQPGDILEYVPSDDDEDDPDDQGTLFLKGKREKGE
ncbi:MAG: helix-turn-helix transcriptional regulator [Firmicutes bacterium]|nr:helix-turn-helix transcriptional regulator [Bacillota bacterium]